MDDSLLIGFDRYKEANVLHAAYNDSAGITAAFNLNLLRILNRELGADFDPRNFVHEAVLNRAAKRIEMYLVSGCRQSVYFHALHAGMELEAGERILTELSHKYDWSDIEDLLTAADFRIRQHFSPENDWFTLLVAQPCRAG